MLELFLDALVDSLKMLPFLFAAYLLIEYLEHRASTSLQQRLEHLGVWGPVAGAVLGVVPQCGFAAAASNFYAGRIISVGTLIAVFLSTSDEAIPVLLAHPDRLPYLLPMLLCKVVSGVVFGLLIDFFTRKRQEEAPFEDLCRDCDCDHHGIFYSAMHHTLEVFVFIFAVNVVLGVAMELVGEERIAGILLQGSVFQPLLAALIGLIPNCAASVLITELFAAGSLSFGACIAGLCAGAGAGLVVLFRTNRRIKENLVILAVLYACAALTGLVVNLV